MLMAKELKPLTQEDVRFLVVHWSATRCDRNFPVESLIKTGIERFGQPSYHWYVRRNGNLFPTLSESVRGAHAMGYNRCSIGICYEGGLDANGAAADTRTPQQKASLLELLKSLRRDYPKAKIIGHRELPGVHKDCPGFDVSEYRKYFDEQESPL